MVVTQEGVCISAGQAAGGPQVGLHPHILLSCTSLTTIIVECRMAATKLQAG